MISATGWRMVVRPIFDQLAISISLSRSARYPPARCGPPPRWPRGHRWQGDHRAEKGIGAVAGKQGRHGGLPGRKSIGAAKLMLATSCPWVASPLPEAGKAILRRRRVLRPDEEARTLIAVPDSSVSAAKASAGLIVDADDMDIRAARRPPEMHAPPQACLLEGRRKARRQGGRGDDHAIDRILPKP